MAPIRTEERITREVRRFEDKDYSREVFGRDGAEKSRLTGDSDSVAIKRLGETQKGLELTGNAIAALEIAPTKLQVERAQAPKVVAATQPSLFERQLVVGFLYSSKKEKLTYAAGSDENALRILANDADDEVRLKVAQNPKTPTDVADKLSQEFGPVGEAVKSTRDQKAKLASREAARAFEDGIQSLSDAQKIALAGSADDRTISILAGDGDGLVRAAAERTAARQRRERRDEEDAYESRIDDAPLAQRMAYASGSDVKALLILSRDPDNSLSSIASARLVSLGEKQRKSEEAFKPIDFSRVSKEQKIEYAAGSNERALRVLARDDDAAVRSIVAKNLNAPDYILKFLATQGGEIAVMAWATFGTKNPGATASSESLTISAVAAATPLEAQTRVRQTPARARLKEGAVGAAFQVLMADQETSQRARRVLNAGETRMGVDGLSANEVRNIGRPGWLAATADPTTVPFVIESVNRQANAISHQLKETLGKTAKPYIATLIIGTGPQASNFANELSRRAPDRHVVMVDASEVLGGGNFASVGNMFNLNSREGEDTGARPLPGTDETLNKVIGPITPADLAGGRWNPAVNVAVSASIAAYSSGADFLMGEKMLDVRDGSRNGLGKKLGWSGRYEVRFDSGLIVYTDELKIATGFGKERIDFADAASRALIKEESDKVDILHPERVPQILTSAQDYRLAQARAEPRAPYRGKDNVTVYVGGGDSIKTNIELREGLGPQNAYIGSGKDDVTKLGALGPAIWLSGEKGFSSCEEYLATSRPRYAALSVLLKSAREGASPRVQPLRAKLTGIAREGTRLRVSYDLFDKDGAPAGTKSVVADRVVLGAGFTDTTGDVLDGVLGDRAAKYKESLEDVMGQPRGFAQPVVVARKLKGQDITFLGKAAGDLADTKELRGVNENDAGLFVLSTRTQEAAKLSASAQPKDARESTRLSPRSMYPVGTPAEKLLLVVEEKSPRLAPATVAGDRVAVFALAQLSDLLQGYRFSTKADVDLSFERRDGRLIVQSGAFDSPALTKLIAQINRSPELLDRLRALTDFGGKPRVVFTFPHRDGVVAPARASVQKTRKLTLPKVN